MSEVLTLLRLELRSLYGMNKYLHSNDRKEKNRYRLLAIVWLFILALMFFYVGALVYGLCSFGLADIVPAYLTVISSFLILAFGLFTAGNRIFGGKGYDILASMPVKTRSIAISRFLSLYAEDLIFTLAIMLPGIGVYSFLQHPGLLFYILALLGTVFIPAIPLVISALLGTFITSLASRMKHKSMAQTVLMVAFIVLVLVGSFSVPGMNGTEANFNMEQAAVLARTVAILLGHTYPPALWLNSALVQSDALSLGLFILVSVLVMALAIAVAALNFHSIMHRMQSSTARHDYSIGAMESRSMLKALYLREAKRYFSSSIYVTNTIVGPIMGCIMAVALCVAGEDAILNSLPFSIDIANIIPFVFAAVFCMMTTSSTSISMEGKQFWVVKSLPIPTKTLLDSKILLNLSLMLPFYSVSVIAMFIALKPNLIQLIWLLLIPVSIMLFVVVFGISVNLKFHSFDWEKEETVVKQSLPSMLGGFAGFLLSAVLGIAVFLIPARFSDTAKALICLLLWAFTLILYRRNNLTVLSEL